MRRLIAGLIAAALCTGQAFAQARDPNNPTCPAQPNWSDIPSMTFTFERRHIGVLKAEGRIDSTTPTKLQSAIDEYGDQIEEIWLRSPGGDARAGTQAGYIIRQNQMVTNIPPGWTCFSACNFMFMGGAGRTVAPGGVFMVHMFTHTANRDAIRREVERDADSAVGLITDIEQDSAILAAEDADFLVRMGIPSRLLNEIMYLQPAVAGRNGNRTTRRCLTPEELREYHVTNVDAFES